MEDEHPIELSLVHHSLTPVRLLINSSDRFLFKNMVSELDSGGKFHVTNSLSDSSANRCEIVIDDCRTRFSAERMARSIGGESRSRKIALVMISNSSRRAVFEFGYADFIGWPIVKAEFHARIEAQCLLGSEDMRDFMYSRDPLVEECCRYLAREISKPVTTSLLARMFATNHNTLNRRFNLELRQSPIEWLRAKRMAVAAAYLAHTRLPISTIAAEVGYERPENFSTAFKRYYGATPMQYRENEYIKEKGEFLKGKS